MIVQILIMLFSGSAIWLVGRTESWRRWGYVAGLCAQPFWFYTAYQNSQWSIIILCLWYTYSWVQGIYNYWLRDQYFKRKATADPIVNLPILTIPEDAYVSGYDPYIIKAEPPVDLNEQPFIDIDKIED